MHIVNTIILAVAFCTIPAGVLWLCRRFPVLGKIGPVFILYLIGLIIGNTGLMPEQLKGVQNIISNATVPLAIPLMLFSCTFSKQETRSQALALVTGMISVIIAVIIGYLIFGVHLEEGNKIGGMLMGVYTGGTINLAALKAMLDVKDSTYVLINSYDILVSFLYLTFLLTIGIKLFRKILPHESTGLSAQDAEEIKMSIAQEQANPYKGIFTKEGLKQAGMATGISVLICGISGGLALTLPKEAFMTIFILMLTTLGIIASFIKKVHILKYSYDIGMYLIYMFCISVASMADMSQLNIAGGANLLGYLLVAVFGSLLLQVIFAKIFRIDSDMMVISSVTFINSPPFVPMMAAAMKNKNVLVPGLSIGIIGYAAGNYLGFLLSEFLKLL
jgi:uncharacterized membrane protein